MAPEIIEGYTEELIVMPTVQMTKTRLIIPETTTFEEWEDIGYQLKNVEGAIQFWVGDWINFGERKWGEKYLEAVRMTGYDYETLRWHSYVAKRTQFVPQGTDLPENTILRRDGLSFTHHKEVAALAPVVANRLLDKAEADALTVSELRAEVREWKAEHEPAATIAPPDIAFSWYHDGDVEATLDAMRIFRAGINKLMNDKRDPIVRITILRDLLVLMEDLGRDINKYMEANSEKPD